MTLQKAMRTRAELKKEMENLQYMIYGVNYPLSFTETKPSEEELTAERNEKLSALDGMTYDEAIKRMFLLVDVCYDLNKAIEEANKEGHTLLYKESSYKAKISMLDKLILSERKMQPEEQDVVTDYSCRDDKGNYNQKQIVIYNYPRLTEETFGMSLVEYRKKLIKELENVRDELSAFNASKKIDYELPANVL